jgi:AcrR family transcriptional regulator
MATKTAQRPRTAARQEKTRAALVRAAHELMTRRGVDAVAVQEVTERANVGAGTFYNYFGSKEDVARAALDCHIANLTKRQEKSVGGLKLKDPAAVIAVSAQSCLRELMTNPLWFWWLKHPDLLVERMRAGFRRYGYRDLAAARASGAVHLAAGDLMATWSALIWQIVAGARDIADGVRDASSVSAITIGILQGLGVSPKEAAKLAAIDAPPYPKVAVDFTFVLTDAD